MICSESTCRISVSPPSFHEESPGTFLSRFRGIIFSLTRVKRQLSLPNQLLNDDFSSRSTFRRTMTKRFLAAGFDVYITADHGNTTRHGMGKLTGTGVEMETKSRCMLVLKDFADKDV